MANIIAVIWDFDKTLIDGYMQDPIFEEYGVNATQFWTENNNLPKKYWDEYHIRVNADTIYLNQFIKYAREGKFKGLNNEKLKEFGSKQKFYPGIPEFFQESKALIENDPTYKEYVILVEHYIVSTGMAAVIRGSAVAEHVAGIWGCELLDGKTDTGDTVISEIVYTLDNTAKTKAIFEINKGVGFVDGVSANSTLAPELRRVPFENMIYIADGPSDVPAFSIINERKGATFAIYPHGNQKALQQVEQLRIDGRINMFAEADYSKDSTAYMWIMNKIKLFANRIREQERLRISSRLSDALKHLT